MVADNTAGLFSTPEQYQQALAQQALANSATMAQLTPEQSARQMAQFGGYQLAGGIAGALGAQDPMLQRQAQRRALIQQVNMADPQSLVQAIQASTSDPELSSYLLGKYKELTGIQKEQSVITKNERFQQASTAAERNRNLISSIESTLAENPNAELNPTQIAQLRWTVAQETKPKAFPDPDTGRLVTIEPIDLSQAAPNIAKFLSNKGLVPTTGAKVVATQIGEPKLGEGTIKELATVDEQLTTVNNAATKLKALIPDVEKLDLGLTSNINRDIRGYLGKPTEDTNQFKELQRAMKAQVNNLLIAAKGTQTEGDARRAADLIADPDTWKNPKLLQDAITDVTKTLEATDASLRVKRTTLSSKGKTEAPNKSPMSNKNHQLQPTEESWVERAMAANKGFSRAQVISEGIKAGKLPAGYQ